MNTVLESSFKSGQVPSSLLLIGATLEQATHFAAELLGPNHRAKIESGNHPDFHILTPEGKSGLHPIANIQEAIREMGYPPFEAKAKIFLILEAEKMQPAAANALLKTLEEPLPDTYFLLTTNRPEKLLPTIISRLTPISYASAPLPTVDTAHLFTFAEERNWPALIAALSTLNEEEPQSYLEAYLEHVSRKNDPALSLRASTQVTEAEQALAHHLKLRTVLLHLLISLTT